LAAKWLYFKSDEVIINHKSEPTKTYQWGDKEILFHHCPICACTTHYSSHLGSGFDRVAINANLLDPRLLINLNKRLFDGANEL
jgi:hypothetical protein